ncbi:MAG TPA: 4-oxalomesaconate tautomerase [Eoetvoesiella sp.]
MERLSDQFSMTCVLMRGGTSKGPFIRLEDLPADPQARDRCLLRLMGALEPRRIDGIGGVDSLTNKVAIISKSLRPGIDVDYLFGQICVHKNTIDYSVNCGNMVSAVGPYAIDEGLVAAQNGETQVRIYNVNTNKQITATVQTPGGTVAYQGDAVIDGVSGTAAPVWLDWLDIVGSKTGALLPTGQVVNVFDGIRVSCVDAAVPMAIAAASEFGLTGYETTDEINGNQPLLDRVEKIRQLAGMAMGLGDVSRLEMPKITLVSKPKGSGTIAARYFMPYTCHTSFAVTGAICLGAAAVLPGTVAHEVSTVATARERVVVEHPSGQMEVMMGVHGHGTPKVSVSSAKLLRTARRLLAGEVYFPVDTLS